jgi:hypothetical protein
VMEESYDLTASEAGVYKSQSGTLKLWGAASWILLILWGVGMAYILPLAVERGGKLLTTLAGRLNLILLAMVVVFGIVIIAYLVSRVRNLRLRGGRGPIRLTVNDSGFQLFWERGPPMEWKWSEWKKPLRIEDYVGWELPFDAQLRLSLLRWAGMSHEAVLALTREAQAMGLNVKDVSVNYAGSPGHVYTITKV